MQYVQMLPTPGCLHDGTQIKFHASVCILCRQNSCIIPVCFVICHIRTSAELGKTSAGAAGRPCLMTNSDKMIDRFRLLVYSLLVEMCEDKN